MAITTDESGASGLSSSSKKRGIENEPGACDSSSSSKKRGIVYESGASGSSITFKKRVILYEPGAPIILYYNEQCNLQKARALHLIRNWNKAGVKLIINPVEEARKGSYVIKMEQDSGNRGGIDTRISRVT
ncbi:hypothetical protein BVRB_2g034870 [Beta vulgaris subsp. vulgaris]|nr:hypothetical protein BVRB_2g034870 [Beta vulgaris subsp. vulgaris]